eukprot:TRINITY_DN6756_c0_g1_i2.p1 TRINITY_DN6756_c0_g1~~TRINITY_DN6756_c0_g1_i2.p1  ORF type:complete len:773 (+),score=128.13 TRINITY_DN6756_c0_g1_i2:276-2321(+)
MKYISTLHIDGTHLTNLTGLENLTQVGNMLTINDNPYLESLKGLENLISVPVLNILKNEALQSTSDMQITGNMTTILIQDNIELEDIDSFSHVNNVSSLSIINSKLVNFLTFQHLTKVDILNIQINSRIGNLSGFENLRTVKNILITDNGNLQTLHGLKNLETVLGYVHIYNNSLVSLEGLDSLFEITDSLQISENNALENVIGLPNLSILGKLQILSNLILKSLSGLSHITKILGDVEIQDNGNLTSIDLDNLSEIGRKLTISNNGLKSLSGLNSLQRVGGIDIYSSDLDNLYGLNNLKTVSEDFLISQESALNISAIQNLYFIGGKLAISNTSRITGDEFASLSHVSILNISTEVCSSWNGFVLNNENKCILENICLTQPDLCLPNFTCLINGPGQYICLLGNCTATDAPESYNCINDSTSSDQQETYSTDNAESKSTNNTESFSTDNTESYSTDNTDSSSTISQKDVYIDNDYNEESIDLSNSNLVLEGFTNGLANIVLVDVVAIVRDSDFTVGDDMTIDQSAISIISSNIVIIGQLSLDGSTLTIGPTSEITVDDCIQLSNEAHIRVNITNIESGRSVLEAKSCNNEEINIELIGSNAECYTVEESEGIYTIYYSCGNQFSDFMGVLIIASIVVVILIIFAVARLLNMRRHKINSGLSVNMQQIQPRVSSDRSTSSS